MAKMPAEKKLEKYVDELNEIDIKLTAIEREEEEAERFYRTLQEHPEELEKIRELTYSVPNYDTFKEQKAELLNRRKVVHEMLKAVSRMLKKAVKYGGWIIKSASGGMSKTWDIRKIKNLGLHGIVVAGKPLLHTVETVNPDVWQAACESGAISAEVAKDAYKETPKTRRASVKRAK